MAFLEAKGLAYAYPGRPPVLCGASLSLERGEVCTVLGRNGAGKTTFLNCLGGLVKPSSGEVLVDGQGLAAMPARLRASKVGFVAQFQPGGLDLEVLDYLVLGDAMRVGLLSVPDERAYAKAERVMADFGIEAMAGRNVGELSGGERQQVEIARVLVQDSDLVLMDEPTNHLDYANQVKVLAMVRRLARECGKAVVLTSHMPDQALVLGGKVALLGASGTLEVGPAEGLVDEPRLRGIYGADVRVVFVPELGRRACVMGAVD